MDSNDPKFFNLQKSMPYARNDNKGRTRAREKDRGRRNSRREKSVIRARIDQVWVGRETGVPSQNLDGSVELLVNRGSCMHRWIV